MKARTIFACAAVAAALPFSAAWATMPTGPQGTGWYGSPNGALPGPQQQLDPYGRAYDGRSATAGETRGETRGGFMSSFTRGPLQGFSADTNPPAPPP